MNEATSLALHGALWWERLMGTLFFYLWHHTNIFLKCYLQ